MQDDAPSALDHGWSSALAIQVWECDGGRALPEDDQEPVASLNTLIREVRS